MTDLIDKEAGELTEIVEGMADAVERRAVQRGLSPTLFAELAGLTNSGLAPVREGRRRNYSTKTRFGVATALGWPVDWYDRILAGEDPDTWPDVEHPPAHGSTEADIAAIRAQLAALEALVIQLRQDLRRLSPQR
jgi:hypothetical protein